VKEQYLKGGASSGRLAGQAQKKQKDIAADFGYLLHVPPPDGKYHAFISYRHG